MDTNQALVFGNTLLRVAAGIGVILALIPMAWGTGMIGVSFVRRIRSMLDDGAENKDLALTLGFGILIVLGLILLMGVVALIGIYITDIASLGTQLVTFLNELLQSFGIQFQFPIPQ